MGRRKVWDSCEGTLLFDVNSSYRVTQCVKNGYSFDKTFYEDQKNERKLRMMVTKVTKEFQEQELQRKKKEAISQARMISAMKETSLPVMDLNESQSDVEEVPDDDWIMSINELGSLDLNSTAIHYETRRSILSSSSNTSKCHASTQTDLTDFAMPNVPIRIASSRNKSSRLIEPRYLEAMSLLMSDNLSATEAIKAVYTVDTVIWKQKRHLPLELDKDYMNVYAKVKKLQSKQVDCLETIMEEASNEDETTFGQIDEEHRDVNEKSSNSDELYQKIEKLKEITNEKVKIRQLEKIYTLPEPKCVRQNHHLLAVHCETQVAEEILQKKCFIMPDGTSRQGVGDIAASVVKVGDKIRALRSTQIASGTRDNWASTLFYMLDRLATASDSDIDTIWSNVSAFLSDLCKVNLHLAEEVRALIGSTWKPGQAFCNLHFTLAIPTGIKEIIAEYQSHVGAQKLFPKLVGFEMNLEDKVIVIQILECWMRLTSIRWQARAWNRYTSFTEYAEKRGVQNVGHMLHANCFGEFEERCAGGVYLAGVWVEWLDTYNDVRNQLACYLRNVKCIMDQCVFLWAGAASIGLHVTVPFMSMLLDHKVTPRQLLTILPALYHDLLNYKDSMCQIESCGILSLSPYFLDPLKRESSPYGIEVCKRLSEYLKSIDQTLMNLYIKKMCTTIAIILKRQRGNQYGFGDQENNPDHVKQNMTDAMLDDPDATNTKPIENLFGNLDREIKKTGSSGFKKVSDDLLIKYSRDTIGETHQWRTKANRNKAEALKTKESEIEKKQHELLKAKVDGDDTAQLLQQNQVLSCITACKEKHNGPLTSVDEVLSLKKTWKKTEKELHQSLNLEIRLRRLTFTNVKPSCPLFRQKGLSIEQKVKNIISLISTQLDMRVEATMNDLEEAILECSTINKDQKKDGPSAPEPSVPEAVELKTSNTTEMPKVGECIVALFTDGAFPGEVTNVKEDFIEADFYVKANIKQSGTSASLWKPLEAFNRSKRKL